jgi:hypothetical protein
MTNDITQLLQEITAMRATLAAPFWHSLDFWISTLIGGGSVLFSLLAFLEARKAKAAATEAGRTVKIQTITIELTEISQRLDKLGMEIQFNEARDMINELSRRLRRLISPFQDEEGLSDTIVSLKEALLGVKNSLNDVRPTDQSEDEQAPHSVYYAIEGDLATINGLVADLLGLFEKRTIKIGDRNDNT